MWTNTCEETARNTVVTSGSDVIHHYAGNQENVQLSIDHLIIDPRNPMFVVTLDIYSLASNTTPAVPVASVTPQNYYAVWPNQSISWDGKINGNNAPQGMYAYKVSAVHSPVPLCNDQDKSPNLTITINDNQFYWCDKDVANSRLTVTVRYTLSEAAKDCTIRFYGADMTTPLGEASGQPTAEGVHWSTPTQIAGAIDAHGTITQPLYCVIWATESDARAAQNRGQDHKQALQAGTTNIVQLVDLRASDLTRAVVPETYWSPDGVENDEDSPGAFVHFNIDDDAQAQANQYAYTDAGDYKLDGPIAAEDDLKCAGITLNAPTDALGKITLQRSDAKLKVWKSGTKGATNKVLCDTDTETWDLSDATQKADFDSVKNSLWVEGCGKDSADLTVTYSAADGTQLATDKVHYTFIAAMYGQQPGQARRAAITGWFPALINCEWSITGPADPTYNCIAFSVGETTLFWLKELDETDRRLGVDQHYGDGKAPLTNAEVDSFYANENGCGYHPIATGPADAEVMYYEDRYHAAKRLHCSDGAGMWIMYESKLGSAERIEHVWDQLGGDGLHTYGAPSRYYKK
jgi:hypothetical protein